MPVATPELPKTKPRTNNPALWASGPAAKALSVRANAVKTAKREILKSLENQGDSSTVGGKVKSRLQKFVELSTRSIKPVKINKLQEIEKITNIAKANCEQATVALAVV